MIDLEAALRLADWLEKCRHEVQASTVRGLVERVRESPAWHPKPTGPGVWVCEPEEGRDSAYVILDLDQQAIDEGAPYFSARVFGPIVGCEAPVYPNKRRRKPEESTNA